MMKSVSERKRQERGLVWGGEIGPSWELALKLLFSPHQPLPSRTNESLSQVLGRCRDERNISLLSMLYSLLVLFL
jgi:hypothetical protein